MKLTSPQRKLLTEANDLASLQQQERSLLQNLERMSDPNSKAYAQLYAQYQQIEKRIGTLQQPQGQEKQQTPHERAEARYNKNRKGALKDDLEVIERKKAEAKQQLRNVGLGLD